MVLLTCRVSALTKSPSYLQGSCSWPSLPAGFVLGPTALLTCRFCARTNSPPHLQVLCSDQQPSSPAGFVFCCPKAFLTCRFSALTNSPPYLQVFRSALTTDVGQESVRLRGLEVQGHLRVGPGLFQLGRAASRHRCVAQELQTHTDLQQATSTDRQIK